MRLQKTLFFADKSNLPEWRLFTFKKWHLGQYSNEIASSLNDLRATGRLTSLFDGPAERLRAEIPDRAKREILKFFRAHFNEWHNSLEAAFPKWAYLNNDAIITHAHDDPSYTYSQKGEVIFSSFKPSLVEFEGMNDDLAERLSDLVDVELQQAIKNRVAAAVERPINNEDWRTLYFDEGQPHKRSALTA